MRPQILIVDDCASTRAALAIALRAAGYATAEAEDGGEALALLRAAGVPPAVVVQVRRGRAQLPFPPHQQVATAHSEGR
jgi:CheY-like chemotaxis protein